MNILEINNPDSEPCLKQPNSELVPKIFPKINYSEFFEKFLLCNKPCIIKNSTENWESATKWLDANNNLNVDYFRQKYGSSEVPIADCGKKIYNVQEKTTMSLNNYLNYWESYQKNTTKDCLYLKDWHFTKDFPGENVYRVPAYFASDWLNEFYGNNLELNDDYRFVYIGPEGFMDAFSRGCFYFV